VEVEPQKPPNAPTGVSPPLDPVYEPADMTLPPAHLMEVTPGAATLGREWVTFDPATGSATLRFLARPEFANRHGTVQGGFLAAMLDSATGITLLATLPEELTAVTVGLDTKFEKPAKVGVLVVEARVVERDDRHATVDAEVLGPDGTIVARGRAKLRIRKRQPRPDN
jgi:uncharacterized protein (TIGR00369 family)